MILSPGYLLLFGACALLSWLASSTMKRKFAKYSRVPMDLTGRDIANRMLGAHNIHNVNVTATRGALTDHYHPLKKTVNLSETVYGQHTLAAAAVAAHECGHAVQHAKAYPMLQFRSALVPVVSLASQLNSIVLTIGLVVAIFSGSTLVLLFGIGLLALTTLFAFITLPVEFDASKRALAWLESSGIARGEHYSMAKDALFWAAMTYVVAALASLAHLFYYLLIFMRMRR